jgi:hypothetical protein
VKEYTRRLGCKPVAIIRNEYALWRTPHINLSIRKVLKKTGALRHLGWENSLATHFSKTTDCNGIVWEDFSPTQQAQEIKNNWPDSTYNPRQTGMRQKKQANPRSPGLA